MKKINSGKLKAIGFDAKNRTLRVEMEGGIFLEYSNVGEETWRRFSASTSLWSFYRDNIEEEYSSKRVSGETSAGNNPLDDLSSSRLVLD